MKKVTITYNIVLVAILFCYSCAEALSAEIMPKNTCEALSREAKACQVDADCVIVFGSGCFPCECYTAYNKSADLTQIKQLQKQLDKHIVCETCNPEKPVTVCKDNLCIEQYAQEANKTTVDGNGKIKDGSQFEHYEDGTIKAELNYKDGRIMYNKTFDEKGHLVESYEPIFLDEKEALQGVLRYYYPGPGEKLKIEMPFKTSGGELGYCPNDVYKSYFESGQLMSVITYRDCQKNGEVQRYYENGQLREYGVYQNDKAMKVQRFNRQGDDVTDDPRVHIELDKWHYANGEELTIYIDNNLDEAIYLISSTFCRNEGDVLICKYANKLYGHEYLPAGETRRVIQFANDLPSGTLSFQLSYKDSADSEEYEKVYSKDIIISPQIDK